MTPCTHWQELKTQPLDNEYMRVGDKFPVLRCKSLVWQLAYPPCVEKVTKPSEMTALEYHDGKPN